MHLRLREAAMAYFDPAVADCFAALGRDNSRAWFTAHRDEYEHLVRDPLQRLLHTAEQEYGDGRVLRPHRDVRFTPDKTPYRLNGGMWAGRVGGVYLEVDAAGVSAGGGLYEPTRDQLQRARTAIAEDEGAADALQAALDGIERRGFEVAGPSLATAPRGWPRDHPRIELLRLRHYAALRRLPLEASRDRILSAWRAARPLIDWAEERVGPATSWP